MSELQTTPRQAGARINIPILAACISILLSLWLIWSDGVVNKDGILYLRSAQAFVDGDGAGAIGIYSWPLYSFLIAGLHQITGLALENAAHLINTLFFALLVYVFVRLVEALNPDSRLGWWAALSILLLPSLNDYRADLIRDAGYWALYLSASLFFVLYLRNARLRFAAAWGLAMVCATLFRIEGIVILFFLPFVLLCDGTRTWQRRWRDLLAMEAVFLICGVVLILYVLTGSGRLEFLGRLTEPLDWMQRFIAAAGGGIAEKASALRVAVLNKFTDDLAVPAVITILALIVISHVVSALGILHAIAAGYALLKKRIALTPMLRKTLLWLIALQLIIAIVSTTTLFFLTGRYLIPLALTLVLFVPVGLSHMFDVWRQKKCAGLRFNRNWLFPLVGLMMVFAAVNSLHSFGPSNRYLREGGQWIERNTPAGATLLTNSEIAAYYAKRPVTQSREQFDDKTVRLLLDEGKAYDYVALDISRKKPEEAQAWRAKFGGEPVVRFRNSRGEQFLIFKIRRLS